MKKSRKSKYFKFEQTIENNLNMFSNGALDYQSEILRILIDKELLQEMLERAGMPLNKLDKFISDYYRDEMKKLDRKHDRKRKRRTASENSNSGN